MRDCSDVFAGGRPCSVSGARLDSGQSGFRLESSNRKRRQSKPPEPIGHKWTPASGERKMTPRKHAVLVASRMGLRLGRGGPRVGQAQAAVYVVDRAASGAADSNPGSEEKPFKTVQHAADAAKPGDTVLRHGGPVRRADQGEDQRGGRPADYVPGDASPLGDRGRIRPGRQLRPRAGFRDHGREAGDGRANSAAATARWWTTTFTT